MVSWTWQKRPCLAAVAVYLERSAGQRPLDEARDHHSVLASLTRADRVEQPGDHAVQLTSLVVGEGEVLVHRFGIGVQPALFRRRPIDAPIVLREWLLGAVIAVNLGARGDEHPFTEAVAVFEHRLGALDVRDHRVDRLLDDQPDADGSREMEDHIAPMGELADDRVRQDGVDDEVKVRPLAELARCSIRSQSKGRPARYTAQSASSRSSARCEPMKPAPPVISAALPSFGFHDAETTGARRSPNVAAVRIAAFALG